jgi:Putative DNA-binding domain
MSTYELPIERIDAALLDSLVRDGVEERRRLEYKRALPGGTDDEKKEFFADTSSFANAAGGDLIYGVSAKRDEQGVATGEPDALIGLPEKNLDAECLRLQDILNAGIRPRLVGVVLQIVRREPEPPCLLVRIPPGYGGLHMIAFKNWNRFYARNANGKYLLDVDEIHYAIRSGVDARDRIRRFRAERVARIVAGDAPVVMGNGPKVIFHAIPLVGSDFGQRLLAQPQGNWLLKLKPIDASVHSWNRNLDGLVVRAREFSDMGESYVQVYRDGTIEVVGVDAVHVLQAPPGMGALYSEGTGPGVAGYYLEQQLLSTLSGLQDLSISLGATGPMVIALTLTGVKGLRIFPHSKHFRAIAVRVDRDPVLAPDIIVEDLSKSVDVFARPVLDMLWQAGGYAGSPHYDDNGRWRDLG